MSRDRYNHLIEIKSSNEAEGATGLVDYNSEEAEASATDFRPSNSETVINALFDEVRQRQQTAFRSSFTALTANAEIGERLIELKKHFPDSARFEEEVKARVGIGKAWCARLCQLAKNFDSIQRAIDWAITKGRFDRPEISVDYAISLFRAWRHEEEGGNKDSATPLNNSSVGKEKISKKELEQQVKDLRQRLEEALQEIALLKAEVARLEKELHPDVLISDHSMSP